MTALDSLRIVRDLPHVVVGPAGLDEALRTLRMRLAAAGVLGELARRQAGMSRGARRRRKARDAEARRRRRAARQASATRA